MSVTLTEVLSWLNNILIIEVVVTDVLSFGIKWLIHVWLCLDIDGLSSIKSAKCI